MEQKIQHECAKCLKAFMNNGVTCNCYKAVFHYHCQEVVQLQLYWNEFKMNLKVQQNVFEIGN